jgi:carbonic anhydrase/acetyltransferase-like protein (isoleucine patch superfamily)
MPLFSFEGVAPTVHPDAWIAPTATLVGDVRIEARASIWYGAVLRADFGPIVIRAGANIQDNSVLHGGADPVTEVGPGATVGHCCVVHGCVVGAETVIGNGATVQDAARIGARCLVGAQALVPPNMVVPDGQLVRGDPATVRGPLTESARWWVDPNSEVYQQLAARHRAGVVAVTPAAAAAPATPSAAAAPATPSAPAPAVPAIPSASA